MRTVYLSDDNTIFEDEYECAMYECRQHFAKEIGQGIIFLGHDNQKIKIQDVLKETDLSQIGCLVPKNVNSILLFEEWCDKVLITDSPWHNYQKGTYITEKEANSLLLQPFIFNRDRDRWVKLEDEKKSVQHNLSFLAELQRVVYKEVGL